MAVLVMENNIHIKTIIAMNSIFLCLAYFLAIYAAIIIANVLNLLIYEMLNIETFKRVKREFAFTGLDDKVTKTSVYVTGAILNIIMAALAIYLVHILYGRIMA